MLRLDHGVMGTHEACGEQEALVLVLSKELDGLTGGLVVRLIRAVAFVTHRDEHAMGHTGGLPPFKSPREDVQIQAGVVARGVSLLAGRVELFGPRRGDIKPICSGDDVTGNPHVVNLTCSSAVESVGLEVLAQIDPRLGSVVAAVHEGGAGRSTGKALAVGSIKDHCGCCESIYIRSLADLITVAPKDAGLKVIRDEKEDVFNLRSGVGEGREKKKEKVAQWEHEDQGCKVSDFTEEGSWRSSSGSYRSAMAQKLTNRKISYL